MKTTRKIFFYITVALFAGMHFSCGSALPEKKPEAIGGGFKNSNVNTTTVEVSTVKKAPFQYYIEATGKIKPLHEQVIYALNGGMLINCYAKNGALFKAGSLLAQLETVSIQQKLERAELTRFNSMKEYESQLLGYENLLKEKTQQEADEIRRKLKISSGMAGAEQDIKEANYQLTTARIAAPFTGVLADVKVQNGQQLKPGQDLFRIYDPYNLLLEVKVLETEIPLLKIGSLSEIHPVFDQKIRYTASVYEINPYVDENGMVLVTLLIRNVTAIKDRLYPGMHFNVVINFPLANTLVVSKDAVVMRNGKAVVFTLEEEKAKWNYVTVGKDNGKEIEIRAGLKEGQKAITTNNLQIEHDAPVTEALSNQQTNTVNP